MNYWNKAVDLEEKLFNFLKEEKFNEFNELLKEREAFYNSYAKGNPSEMKSFLNSEEFKKLGEKINEEYQRKKEGLINEMKGLVLSKRATEEYKNNISKVNVFFSKKV